jgi:SSS family solute:Na+ symporter
MGLVNPVMRTALSHLLLLIFAVAFVGEAPAQELRWDELPPLPDTIGFGGPFAGVHNDALIVAGGANFPDAPPWDDGQKIWYDDIYVLESGASEWRTGWKLKRPLAYGASVSTDQGLVLIGGSDAERVYADVQLLRWNPDDKTVEQNSLPPLPVPSCYHAAALTDDVIYVVAGRRAADPTALTKAFWALDMSEPPETRAWETLDPWPGEARIKTVAAAQSGGSDQRYVYLFSGEIPTRDEDGNVSLRYVTESYRFNPDAKPAEPAWERVADVPKPVAAGCAIDMGQSHILVFSGSTGRHVREPPEEQPEFPPDVLAYNTITDTWTKAGDIPQSVVTTNAVRWGDGVVIASGEIRPGVRTPQVQVAYPARGDARFGTANYGVLIAYLAVLIGMGAYFSRREKSTSDFFLAGKRIPWWAAGLSVYATQLSAITFVSLPALAYATDWMIAPGYIMIFVMAPIVIFFYLPFYCRLNVTTAYEYLERRFNLSVRLFGSASFISFQLLRMAVVVYLPALALAAITGINVYVCILLMGVLATVYTFLGGMEAVIWTDVIQAVVLTGGVLISLALVLRQEGGMAPVYEAAVADGKLRMANWTWSYTELATWSVMLGSLMLQFGPYTTDQAVIQRYLSTKNERAAARGVWMNGIISVPGGLVFFLLGSCLYVFFKARPELLDVSMQNDQVFPLFIARELPQGISGLVIAGIFAASMSSLDSSMHSVSTAITVDFYRRFKPDVSDHHCLIVARRIVLVVGVLAVLVACALVRYDIKSLYFFFQKILGLVSSGLVGIFILGIFTRRSHAQGVLVGAAAGIAALVYVTWYSSMNFYLYSVVGTGTCVLVGYLMSLILPRGGKELTGLTLYTQPPRE